MKCKRCNEGKVFTLIKFEKKEFFIWEYTKIERKHKCNHCKTIWKGKTTRKLL